MMAVDWLGQSVGLLAVYLELELYFWSPFYLKEYHAQSKYSGECLGIE